MSGPQAESEANGASDGMDEDVPLTRYPPGAKLATLGFWRDFLIVSAISITGLYYGATFLVPLAMAMLAFVLLTAIVDRIEGFGVKRWIAQILGLAVIFGGVAGIVLVLAGQADEATEAFPRYQARFDAVLANLVRSIGEENADRAVESLAGFDLSGLAVGLADAASSFLSGLLLVLLYVPFMIAERMPMFAKIPLAAGDPKFAAEIRRVLASISIGLQRYVGIKTFVSVLTGLLSYAVMKPVGLDFAETWAVLAFALNFIPSIGSVLGAALPSILALVQFETLTPFLIVAVGCSLVQFVIGNIVEPAMTGKSLNLSPLMVIIGLTFWTVLWGIPGALLSVPITVCLVIVFANLPGTRPLAIIMSGDGNLSGGVEEVVTTDQPPEKPLPGEDGWSGVREKSE